LNAKTREIKNHCSPASGYRLGIVTPILKIDEYARELAISLESLRSRGCVFTHLIVHASAGQPLQDEFPNAKLLQEREHTHGVYDALKQGFDHLIKEGITHLSWINADDLLEDGFEKVVHLSEKSTDAIVSGSVQWIAENGESFGAVPQWRIRWGMRELFHRNIPPFTQQGMIFPKETWAALGGFDTKYELIADSVFWDKALEAGYEVKFSHALAASYRIRRGQLSANQAKAAREFNDWHASQPEKQGAGILETLIILLFRVQNTPIYIRRFFSNQKMITSKAVEEGSFHKKNQI